MTEPHFDEDAYEKEYDIPKGEESRRSGQSVTTWIGRKIIGGVCVLIALVAMFFTPLSTLAWHYVSQSWQRSEDIERSKNKHLKQMRYETEREAAALGITVEELRIRQLEEIVKNNPNDEFAKSMLRVLKKQMPETTSPHPNPLPEGEGNAKRLFP